MQAALVVCRVVFYGTNQAVHKNQGVVNFKLKLDLYVVYALSAHADQRSVRTDVFQKAFKAGRRLNLRVLGYSFLYDVKMGRNVALGADRLSLLRAEKVVGMSQVQNVLAQENSRSQNLSIISLSFQSSGGILILPS